MTNDLSEEHTRAPAATAGDVGVCSDRVSSQPRRLVVTHFADQLRDGSTESPTRRSATSRVPARRRCEAGRSGAGRCRFPPGARRRRPRERRCTTSRAGSLEDGSGTRRCRSAARTTPPFVSSDGGDRLFFRHVQDPVDRSRRLEARDQKLIEASQLLGQHPGESHRLDPRSALSSSTSSVPQRRPGGPRSPVPELRVVDPLGRVDRKHVVAPDVERLVYDA